MPKRIHEDWNEFRRVVGGKTRKELKKWMSTGRIFRKRGKNGKIAIPIPKINLPHFRFGKPQDGVGSGPGKPGDEIGKDDTGKGGKGKAGQSPGDPIYVDVEMKLEDILKILGEELELPNIKQKPTDTFEEIRVKYNGLSLNGPDSLLHKKRTILQTMKRQAAMGTLDEKFLLPGMNQPISVLRPINEDKRYRQYNEIRKPSSNAVIFFARDGSDSMGEFKIDVVSDMAYWIDAWIRAVYGEDKTERVYIWHDTEAKEVSEKRFYGQKYGGGTTCSSAMKLIANMLEHRYKPEKYNIYVFYFGDGENWGNDNSTFCKVIRERLRPDEVTNFVGITQILSWRYDGSLKKYVDSQIDDGKLNKFVRTCAISKDEADAKQSNSVYGGWNYGYQNMTDEERDKAIKEAIQILLGANQQSRQTIVA